MRDERYTPSRETKLTAIWNNEATFAAARPDLPGEVDRTTKTNILSGYRVERDVELFETEEKRLSEIVQHGGGTPLL